MAPSPASTPPVTRQHAGSAASLERAPVWPGVAVCLLAAVIALAVQQLVPGVSALLVAILLGVIVAHTVQLPARLSPGVAVAARGLLRAGIVLLGLQLVLGDIVALGWAAIGVVVAVVGLGMCGTVLMGRLLRMSWGQSVLVAAGFSICGAAAVAAVEGSIEREDEDVATAIALVVLFGTLMIGAVPLLLALTHFSPQVQGMIAGGSIHEVAQVVAAGGLIGGGALTTAVVVKLARVLMLAPVVTVLALLRRHAASDAGVGTARPPLVPVFVVGFLGAAVLRTLVPLPDPVLEVAHLLQGLLLSAAMFALGLGVHISMLRRTGPRPFLLGTLATLLVTGVATSGFLFLT